MKHVSRERLEQAAKTLNSEEFDEWCLDREREYQLGLAAKRGKPAHFYVVSTGENWKWGITTKDCFKKRSSAYEECFLWESIKSMTAGRGFEKRVGSVMTNILKEEMQEKFGYGHSRGMHHEDVDQSFPLPLLLEIVKEALDVKADTAQKWNDEYRHACAGCDEWDAPIPSYSSFWKKELNNWRNYKKKETSPMW